MLRNKLQTDQITALKNKNQDKVTILRYILAQIKNKEIEKKSELNDEETLTVLRKIVKELNESIDAFRKGKREDLIGEYQKQLDLISVYLPKEISDAELKQEIEKLMTKNKELYEKNPKAIIGICMRELKPKASPNRIMQVIQSLTS